MYEQEEWRPVVGWPHYQVSSEGRVRSSHSWRGEAGRILVGHRNPNGYRCVILCGPAGKMRQSVHRLVAAAFHGPLPEGLQTRHLDGNQLNNRAENLRYGTAVENAADKKPPVPATRCVQGHPFDERNTFFEADGKRRCRICRRAIVRRYRERRMFRAAGIEIAA